MKKSFFIGLLMLLQTAMVFAQTKSSLLWEISGNGLQQTSYLFGTIHLIGENDFYVRPEIDSVFNLSPQVAFEIKLDDVSMLPIYQQWLPLPDSNSLSDYCTPEEFEKLKKYLKDSLQTDIVGLQYQKPFAVSQIQTMDYIKDDVASYELYFLQKCILNAKPIKGLESLSDQLRIFDLIPYEEQIDLLIAEIDSAKNQTELWDKLIEAYKAEDLVALNKFLYAASPEILIYEEIFLTNRNKNWIPVIETMISENKMFIAVGAAHLLGENGLLNLLELQGYTLTPI